MSQQDEFTADMIKAADAFVEWMQEMYVLDYTVESLQLVDEALEDASDHIDDMSEARKKSLIQSAGAYIFEVARRNFGGKYYWYDQLDQPIFVTGQPEFEASFLAFEKVKGRLDNGAEDNIPFFFAGYVERVRNKQSAMIV
jgi:hypothetical protein